MFLVIHGNIINILIIIIIAIILKFILEKGNTGNLGLG